MYEYRAKLLKVIDGDTIDVLIDLGFDVWVKARLRLYGINTPESRTRDKEEKKLGLQAKHIVETYLTEDLIITTKEKGKYGRYLAVVYPSDKSLSINNYLLKLGLAKPYFGGKRN